MPFLSGVKTSEGVVNVRVVLRLVFWHSAGKEEKEARCFRTMHGTDGLSKHRKPELG
jgi:hypothetical protein